MKPGRALLVLTGFTWVCLIGVEFGLPLDFSTAQARKFETPITPAGYAFGVIWTIIFLLQGLGAFAPWAGSRAPWAAVGVAATGWPWIFGWAFEMLWTLAQFLLARRRDDDDLGRLTALVLAPCVGLLLGGHVAMGCALRAALAAVQQLQAQGAGTGSLVWASILYIVPSGLNCGWLALATCLGALDLAIACGASYDGLVPWSLALLLLAACSLAAQPWLWGLPLFTPPLQPGKGGGDGDPDLAAAAGLVDPGRVGGYSAPALLEGVDCEAAAQAEAKAAQVPLMGAAADADAGSSCGGGGATALGALGPGARAAAFVAAAAAYAAALAWGFVGIVAAERPGDGSVKLVKGAALGLLLLALPGLCLNLWLRSAAERKRRLAAATGA